MLEQLKEEVYQANIDLVRQGLVAYTWGNVSGICRKKGVIVIKPSGVDYARLTAEMMVVVDLTTGKVVDGALRPSSDTETHLVLYRSFPNIKGVAHTHSVYATAFAQAGRAIPMLGTTHADCFAHDVPLTRDMVLSEMREYEKQTGEVIVEAFSGLNPDETPGVLVRNHGPFTWGKSPWEAVYHSRVLEVCAQMAYISCSINPHARMNMLLAKKHYERKHGANAYYGQFRCEEL